MKKYIKFFSFIVALLFCFGGAHAFAHEVYVLPHAEVESAMAKEVMNPLDVIAGNMHQFFFWAFLVIVLILTAFFASIVRRFEEKFDPFLMKLKRHAPKIARITVGIAFIAASYYNEVFGPELSLAEIFGGFDALIRILLLVIGILIVINKFVRPAAFVALAVFIGAVLTYREYMLTYVNYIGEILVLLFFGGHRFHKYAPLLIRVCFGAALIYASLYAKVLHSNLALDTITAYHLTNYFPFEPHFFVLGASIVEMLVGLFFIFGIEIRLTALFLEFWLFMSLLYFGEVVWPHVVLIGIPIALFCHGYDKYSLEGRFFKKGRREPVF